MDHSYWFVPMIRVFIPKPQVPGKLRAITQPHRLVLDAMARLLLEE